MVKCHDEKPMRIFLAFITTALLLQQIRVDVDLQQIEATVRDKSGHLVKGLAASEFIVEEDGIRQPSVHVEDDPDVPLSLGILIDNSGSMASMPGSTVSGVGAAIGIGRVFIRLLKPTDEVQLMTFAKGVSVREKFTENQNDIDRALVQLRANGGTSVLEALPTALQEMKKSRFRKRALVLMTDAYFGGDIKKVRTTVRNTEVPIYTFAMRGVNIGLDYPPGHGCTSTCHAFGAPPPPRDAFLGITDLTVPFLDALAEESGGRSTIFELHTPDSMARIYASLEDIVVDLRGQYMLGYYPAKPRAALPAIRVRMSNPNYQVRFHRLPMQTSEGH
jgi:VWFA-related protein